jgi:CHAT domain-containing protein
MLSYSTGQYEQAVQHCLQALEIQRVALGEKHPEMAENLSNLAVLYYAIGAHERAIFYGQQAYELQSTLLGDQHPDVGGTMSNLAATYAATNQRDEALHLMQQVAVIDNQMVEQVFSMSSERQRLSYLSTLQGDMDALLSLVLQSFSNDPVTIEAATDLVLRRKAVTIEVLAAQQEARLGERYPQLTSHFQELTDLRTQITQKVLAGPDQGEDIQDYQLYLNELNERKEKLETYIVRRIPEMRISRRTQHVTHQKIAKALPPESALVEFVRCEVFDFQAVPAHGDSLWMPARYLAFIIFAGEPDFTQMIDLVEADRLDAMLANFRMAITGKREANTETHTNSLPLLHDQVPLSTKEEKTASRQVGSRSSQPDGKAYLQEGRELRAAVFDPLVAALKGHTRLFLAPDGDLTRLPFEILPADAAGGSCLIETYQISYLGTGRDILRPTRRQPKPAPPLMVADPDFDLGNSHISSKAVQDQETPIPDLGPTSLPFDRLLGTITEGKQIGALLEVQPLLREAALETAIKACHSPRILHIATHGFFLDEQALTYNPRELALEGRLGNLIQRRVTNPLLLSGLALAGANTWNLGKPLPVEAEDGLLTAEDVSGLDLLDTELVVLSACETGLGQVHTGEGVFGLRRAFALAGAKTLIMSLWKVHDQQTQELMEDFYHRVLSGQHYAEALRAAQLTMKAKYTRPFYWGAFICQGTLGVKS